MEGGVSLRKVGKEWCVTYVELANPDDPIYLNDVWQLQTGRATHCASSFMPHTRCSARQCILGMDGSPPTLGTAVREKLVQLGRKSS
eukprot:6490424-Amphidinium_carterae.1